MGTPRVGPRTSQYGRDYQVGYGPGLLEQGKLNFELGVGHSFSASLAVQAAIASNAAPTFE